MTRKESLSVSLFTSSKLAELVDKMLLSSEDYFELFYHYVQVAPPSLSLMASFLRLIDTTKSTFELEEDWAEKFRSRLEGRGFIILIFYKA